MPDPNKTEIIFIMDRSGSMSIIQNDVIGGFNSFLAAQQKLTGDDCRLTYIQFDTEYETVHECKPIQDVKPLDHATYQPRGATALLDAVGMAITETGKRLAKLPEHKRPGQIVVAIFTDGEENSSHTYTKEQIKGMVELQTQQYQWNFLFLGANQDSFAEASSIGILRGTTANYALGSFVVASNAVSKAVGTYRSTGDNTSLTLEDDY